MVPSTTPLGTAVAGRGDHFPPAIVAMIATARAEIARHQRDGGDCTVCAEPYPCTRSRMADLALGGF